MKKIGPCKILEKRNNNAYKVELLEGLDISPIFNVFDVYAFHGEICHGEVEGQVNWKEQHPKKKKEHIMQILDQKVITTRHGQYPKYLVLWEGLYVVENSWILEGDLKKLDSKKL